MKIIFVLPAFVVSLLLSGSALAIDHPIVPHEAEYRVKISLLRGRMSTRVEAFDAGYRAQSTIEPKGFASILKNGSILEKSEFVLTPGGIRPNHYESSDSLSKRPK
ncbi:MAG: hypothetical protein HKN35_04805, partial [Woeseia sp.]|nr:hypothetical protein [Woeseia sp.]